MTVPTDPTAGGSLIVAMSSSGRRPSRCDYLEIKLWSKLGEQLAAESLYAEEDDDTQDSA